MYLLQYVFLFYLLVLQLFFIIALLVYNSHIIQLNHLMCTIQWFLICSQFGNHHHLVALLMYLLWMEKSWQCETSLNGSWKSGILVLALPNWEQISEPPAFEMQSLSQLFPYSEDN